MNLIDGLDGLAAGVGGIASVTLMLVAWQEGQYYVTIITAAIAGPPWDFYPIIFIQPIFSWGTQAPCCWALSWERWQFKAR